jgi:hypothetical protein
VEGLDLWAIPLFDERALRATCRRGGEIVADIESHSFGDVEAGFL